MTRLAIITPSFGPDFELCAALHRSVLAHAPDSARHHIIVPRADQALFRRLAGPRAEIHDEAEFLPRSIRRLPKGRYSLNLRRPLPPLRGWILQQIIKLAAASRSTADVVLLVDSDITFVRPFTAATYLRNGVVRLYRKPDEVDERLPRHVVWHRTARRLLGLPPAAPPYPDYVSSVLAWDPVLVRRLLAQVSETTGRGWVEAIGACLHFSEWTLYGVFVENLVREAAAGFDTDPLCHAYWDETPLDERSIAEFLAGIRPTDVAVMISAKSRTPLPVRQAALARLSLA